MEFAMDAFWKTALWKQYGAAIDMLENAMHAAPEELWNDRSRGPKYWYQYSYQVYHTLFWLDFYLSESEQGFAPPAPFTLDEMDPAGLFPERPYTKAELQRYLEHGRAKCRAAISALTDEKAQARCGFARYDMSVFELLVHNLRHVQHHTAQLNLILRQTVDAVPGWVGRTPGDLDAT
jgi:hypothetical protein